MKEVYFSKELNKYFDDKEECLKAEKEFEEKHAAEIKAKEERMAEAKEVEETYKHYLELRSEFIKKYGQYHMTLTDSDLPSNYSIVDLFNWLW